MKVLDVELFREGIRRHAEMLSRQRTEIEAIFHSVYGLVSLEDVLKGQGGEAIRTFYAECHLPFLQYFMTFEERFTEVLTSMDGALSSLEPNASGFIRESFLEGEVEQGLTQIAQLTESLTDETNSIMQQVSDIVALPQLDDSEVQAGVRSAKLKKEDTITSLHEFDAQQTNALTPIEQDLNTMETWLSDIEGLFASGLTDVNFPAEQWAITSSQNTLQTDLVQRTMPIGPLPVPGNTPFSYVLPVDFPNICDVPVTKPVDTGIDIAKGIGVGLYDAGKDFVKDIWDFLVNPIELVEGVAYAVIHPVETFTYLKTAITDSYQRDVTNGDAYSRSRWFTYAIGTIGTSIVGTKGAGALTRTGVSSTRVVVQNTTLQSGRLTNLLPYGPKLGLAKFEKIPFNVLNGPEIRSQLLSTFKTTSKNSNTIKNASAVMKDKLASVQAQFAKGSVAVGKVIDETITNVKNILSKSPEFSFAGGVVRPIETTSHTFQNPGKDLVSKIEGVSISGKDITKDAGKDIQIPSVRNNEFNKWFDNLSFDEFGEMWSDPHLRSKIEDRIRRPGGYHEWHLVARTPQFKEWGVRMDDIKEMRTLIKDVEFVNPSGRHGRRGSTKAHNEILKIIDSVSDYESFVRELNKWASNRMKNGVLDLPEGLRR